MLIVDLKRAPGENEEQYIWRLGQAKDNGSLDALSWSDIAELVNAEFRADESEYFGESAYRKSYQQAKRFYEAGAFGGTDDYLSEIEGARRELQKDRIKLQSDKVEYNRWLREDARNEMIIEKIVDAIRSTKTEATRVRDPEKSYAEKPDPERAAILAYGDEHFGAEFKLYGLFGEVISEYSPEIFYDRMNDLLRQSVEIIRREGLDEVHVMSLGDFTEGMIHVGQLMKLRYGFIESTIRYARFVADWLDKLTEFVSVKYYSTTGNHSELRLFDQKKGSFKEENLGFIVDEIISIRLEDNPRFTFVTNPTGMIYAPICGMNVLGIHGDCSDLSDEMAKISMAYGANVDIVIGGHIHHGKSEELARLGKEAVNIPSIVGVNDFALDHHMTADPGASLFVVEAGKGIGVSYRIRL